MAETSVASIEQRTPVINKEASVTFPLDKLDSQWGLVTEVVRRDLSNNPQVRKALIGFCTQPVSESLPGDFLTSLSNVDLRVSRIAHRFQAILPSYLKLPPVPDELITPDVRYAAGLRTPEDVIESLGRIFDKNDPLFESSLGEYIKAGAFTRGITREERLMIIKRYKFARDVKIFALAAEILEQGGLTPDQEGEINLPSGIRIGFDTNQVEQRKDLLNPHLWEKRRQIKDRVYEISVGGRRYILKEKKTARHTDTKKHGHIEGRTSEEEFAIARYFQENGRLSKDRVSIDWEKPIGFVSYPDGFQFSVFEYEDMTGDRDIGIKLASEIINHRKTFEQEYHGIAQLAQKYKDHHNITSFDDPIQRKEESGIQSILKRLRIKRNHSIQLTFEEFARVKSQRMLEQARDLLDEAMTKNEYGNSDIDGSAYRIHTNGDVKLDILGFDFEYFEKISPEEATERAQRRLEFWRKDKNSNGIRFMQWMDGYRVTRMERAAYFAFLEAEGIMSNSE